MALIETKDKAIAELETKVTAAEKQVEDMSKNLDDTQKDKDQKLNEAEAQKKKCAEELAGANASLEEKEKALAEKEASITELQAKIAELEPMKTELETMKAEAEAAALKEKQENAKAFAQKQGLDVEQKEIAEAIASLNYEAIAEMSMKVVDQKRETKTTLASYAMTDGMEVKGLYGGLLESR